MRKRRAKTAAQTHIQQLYPPVSEVVIENEKNKLRGIWKK